MGDFSHAYFGYFKDDVLKEMSWGGGVGYLWVPGTYVNFQHGLYLRVLIPRKGKECQRGGLQVIRKIPCGNHV